MTSTVARTTIASTTSPLSPNYPASQYFSAEDYSRFHERAVRYDADNTFFTEDFEDLRAAGYLVAALPAEYGGRGLTLSEVAREQRQLAYWAPATALAVNMHLYWTGPAAALTTAGVEDLTWLLEALRDGQIFAAGHGERGNDVGLDNAQVRALPQPDGSYLVNGRKTFTSLGPAWTSIGIHALDDSDPANPVVVHLFVDRDQPGVRTEETWDTLGVRATRSDDTVFENARAEASTVVGTHAPGAPYPPYINGILGWYLPLVANVYFGIARRALDVAILAAQARPSLVPGVADHASKPAVQRQIAEAEILLDAAHALLETTTRDADSGVDLGNWAVPRLFSAKEFTTRTAKEVVDIAVQVAGAAAVSRRNELERLYRDVRTGQLHPPNTDAILDVIGKFALGVLP
ncbi:acyl-CoA dehydrogenase family protein [Nocardia camponoti]|uniref:Acyl-CoA dehydrogenase n=1 Tax=Nocardia camponoti TaxID=1616106 RepID=A0A917Q8R6_9NOCA|nr:acyl-CoA dehydrogenase family protein [Nocardia camponoti]GGK35925.1 acyl-CoA dehydrogenase [Nocardia camponoti]